MASVQDMISSCDAHDAFRAALCSADIISHSLDGGIMHEGGATAQHRARQALSDALVQSLQSGCQPITKILIKMGSEPDFPSSEGVLPKDVAEAYGKTEWLEGAEYNSDQAIDSIHSSINNGGHSRPGSSASAGAIDDRPVHRKKPKKQKYATADSDDLRKQVQVQNLQKYANIGRPCGSTGSESPLSMLCHKGPPLREGWVKKLGRHFPTWHSRYFLLFPGRLEYYIKDPFVPNCKKVPNSQRIRYKTPRGVIILDKPCSVEDISKKKGCPAFQLEAPSRKLICCCSSSNDLRGWIAAIKEAYEGRAPRMDDLDNWSFSESDLSQSVANAVGFESDSTAPSDSPRTGRGTVDFDFSSTHESSDDDSAGEGVIHSRRCSSANGGDQPRKSSMKKSHIRRASIGNSNEGKDEDVVDPSSHHHPSTSVDHVQLNGKPRRAKKQQGGSCLRKERVNASNYMSSVWESPAMTDDDDLEKTIQSTSRRLSVWSIGSVELAQDMIDIGSQEDNHSFGESIQRWCNQIREFFNSQIPVSNRPGTEDPKVPYRQKEDQDLSGGPACEEEDTVANTNENTESTVLERIQQEKLSVVSEAADPSVPTEGAATAAKDLASSLFCNLTERTETFNRQTVNQFLSLLTDRENVTLLCNSYMCTHRLEACLERIVNQANLSGKYPSQSRVEHSVVEREESMPHILEDIKYIDFVSNICPIFLISASLAHSKIVCVQSKATAKELTACSYILLACDDELIARVRNVYRVCRTAGSQDVCFDEAGYLFAVLEIYVRLRKDTMEAIEGFLQSYSESPTQTECPSYGHLKELHQQLKSKDVGMETFAILHNAYLDEHVKPELQTYSANIFIQVCNLLCSAWNSQSAPLISTVAYQCVLALNNTCSRCASKCRDPGISPDTVVHVVNDFGNAIGVFRLFNEKVAAVIEKAREQLEVHHETVHYLSAEEIRKEATEAEQRVLQQGLRASGLLAQKLVNAFDDNELGGSGGESFIPTISTRKYAVGKGFSEFNRRASSSGIISLDSIHSGVSGYSFSEDYPTVKSKTLAPLQRLFTPQWDEELESDSAPGIVHKVCDSLKRQLRGARISLDPWFGKAQYSRVTAQLAITYLSHFFDAIRGRKRLRSNPFRYTKKRQEHIECDIEEIVSGFAPLMSQRVASAVLFPLSITLRLVSLPPSTMTPVIACPLLLCARGAPEWYSIIASVVQWRTDISKKTKKDLLRTTECLIIGYVEKSEHIHVVGSDLCMYILREAVLRSETTSSLLTEERNKRVHKCEDAFRGVCDPFHQ